MSAVIAVRPLRPDEARAFLEVHHAAIRGIPNGIYPLEVIEAWSSPPVTEAVIERFLQNPGEEIRLVAEVDGQIVGIGALVVANSELRACYIHPAAARQGVGSALVSEIERIAKDDGLTHLQLASSINAEPFYASHGYEVVERGEHVLRTGVRMASVKMRKSFAQTR